MEDKNALMIKGGHDCGTGTVSDAGDNDVPIWIGDWDDEFCC